MHSILKLILTVLVVITALGATDDVGVEQQTVAASLADRFPSDPALDRPGFIVSVLQRGDVLFSAANGAADIEQSRPINEHSVFHIASLSKQITAAALVHAIRDQRVSLEDPVSKWLPATSHYGDSLTVAHLAYMTSGLTDYLSLPRPNGQSWTTFHYFTNQDAIRASLSVSELNFAPGSQWQYNNMNYMLIAEIVEVAYQLPFAQVVEDKIFAPLGMHDSLINDDATTIIPNRANAYLERSDRVRAELRDGAGIAVKPHRSLVMIRRNSPHYGGSGVMTSMSDWQKWNQELLSHRLFGNEFWSIMKQRRTFDHEKTNDALGLVHGVFNGQPTLWYSGGDIDTSTYNIVDPSADLAIACFSNNPLKSCESLARDAFEIVLTLRRSMHE